MSKYIVCFKDTYHIENTYQKAVELEKAWPETYLYTIEIDT